MRIIAGSARRTPLAAPKGQDTRPTADRVKENLFNILAPNVAGSRFLDLFCGSGAIGIEALSRGAREAVFADSSRDAVSALTANLTRAKLTGRILPMCALGAIPLLSSEGKGFDIIFLDPPYGQGLLGQALTMLAKSPLIPPTGIVIAECQANEAPPECGLALQDIRKYGGTQLMFYSSTK
ncbi:MAG: 16S rRNA (guanine(966)-N(2))-methyltransferase RsmD [Defluviitaleaceae bacterium]|nr:16S rRNA (guanine(966)-N(2))-methyltransferase RsmD [Defluviitaleaceae bacterium]